eukprot:8947318-Heterocapsa_arctica.AAC.1
MGKLGRGIIWGSAELDGQAPQAGVVAELRTGTLGVHKASWASSEGPERQSIVNPHKTIGP